jgi:hypothetical protein
LKRRTWNVGFLIAKIKEEARTSILKEMNGNNLAGRVGILLILFTCCRINDMFNIEPRRCIWATQENTMAIAMRTKEGRGRLKYKMLLSLSDGEIDPIASINEYRERHGDRMEKSDKFFFFENGSEVDTVDHLSSKILTPYLRRIGIPKPYTPYSIKTAVTTSLFDAGFSKEKVSAFTGHSSNANTALKYYNDSLNNWLGHHLAKQGATELKAIPIGNSGVGNRVELGEGGESSEEEEGDQPQSK